MLTDSVQISSVIQIADGMECDSKFDWLGIKHCERVICYIKHSAP